MLCVIKDNTVRTPSRELMCLEANSEGAKQTFVKKAHGLDLCTQVAVTSKPQIWSFHAVVKPNIPEKYVLKYVQHITPLLLTNVTNDIIVSLRCRCRSRRFFLRPVHTKVFTNVSGFGVIENASIDPRPHYRFRSVFNCPQ